jgi:hypothetical protein
MSAVQRLIVGLTAIGLLTTAVLPGRQTEKVIKASGSAVQGLYYTVISGKK